MNPTELETAIEYLVLHTKGRNWFPAYIDTVISAAKSHLLHLKQQEAMKGGDVAMAPNILPDTWTPINPLTSPEHPSHKTDEGFVGASTPRTDAEVDHPSNVQLDNECKNRRD